MKTIMIGLLFAALPAIALETEFQCKAYCVQIDYGNGRINLIDTYRDQSKTAPGDVIDHMTSLCGANKGNFYLVKNFDLNTRRKIDSSYSKSSYRSVGVNGEILVRNGFLGIGRKTKMAAGANATSASSSSGSYSDELDFQFKLDLATPENSCPKVIFDPNTPIRYLNGKEIFG